MKRRDFVKFLGLIPLVGLPSIPELDNNIKKEPLHDVNGNTFTVPRSGYYHVSWDIENSKQETIVAGNTAIFVPEGYEIDLNSPHGYIRRIK